MDELLESKLIQSDMREGFTKGLVGTVPVVGSIVNQMYDTCTFNNLKRRQERWNSMVEERLLKLELDIKDLSANDNFVTSLLMISRMVVATSDDSKRQYFSNALFNSVSIDMDEVKICLFLRLLDKYSIAHIRLLKFFQVPSCKGTFGGSRYKLIEDAFSDLAKNRELLNYLIKDLNDDGLTSVDVYGMVGSIGKTWTSKLGDEFLAFISDF